MTTTLFAVALILTAFLIALAVLMVFGLVDRRRNSRLREFSEAERDSVVFIFEDETLIDATPAARQMLDATTRQGSAWVRLASLLAPSFPRLSDRIGDLAELGNLVLTSADGNNSIKAEWHDGVARLTLASTDTNCVRQGIDSYGLLALNQELEALRATADHTPYPLWQESPEGIITWCNTAYLDIADRLRQSDDSPSWPPVRIFEIEALVGPEGNSASECSPRRVAICPEGETSRQWFEIASQDLEGGNRFCSAVPADRLVHAETTLAEFVTTLTKTFASLPIGLAIFNRARELALFNPALMDLTVLPAEFLISKPSLSAFLDKLREARMMPEPKDYRSWRQQMSDLVVAAQNGTYEETWTLPTGQTYRVTGRPHPDGAVALLFEDISAEISVTRRFRAELETSQAALDALPQAVVVFSPGGILSITNHAYTELWGSDPSTSLGDITIRDAISRWKTHCAPSAIWDQISAFVSHIGPRESWTANLAMMNGRLLHCRVTPLARGATLVAFSENAADTRARLGTATASGGASGINLATATAER